MMNSQRRFCAHKFIIMQQTKSVPVEANGDKDGIFHPIY